MFKHLQKTFTHLNLTYDLQYNIQEVSVVTLSKQEECSSSMYQKSKSDAETHSPHTGQAGREM